VKIYDGKAYDSQFSLAILLFRVYERNVEVNIKIYDSLSPLLLVFAHKLKVVALNFHKPSFIIINFLSLAGFAFAAAAYLNESFCLREKP